MPNNPTATHAATVTETTSRSPEGIHRTRNLPSPDPARSPTPPTQYRRHRRTTSPMFLAHRTEPKACPNNAPARGLDARHKGRVGRDRERERGGVVPGATFVAVPARGAL